MGRFKVSFEGYAEVTVEADNEEEAERIAFETVYWHGADHSEQDTDQVKELK